MSQADPTNHLLAEQAKAVIAGVLKHPSTWVTVNTLVGELLDPKALRATQWIRTAWRGLGEIFDVGEQPDLVLLREKMQGLATLGRPELLNGWKSEDTEALREVYILMDLVLEPVAVTAATERLVQTFASHDLQRRMAAVQRDLGSDPLADPYAAVSELQRHVQATCKRVARVPLDNAAVCTRAALSDTRAQTLPSGFYAIDMYNDGIDLGQVTMLGARTGVGKSALLQALARNQVFPVAAKPSDDPARPVALVDRLQVNDAPDRPFVLVINCENSKAMFYERLACDMLQIDASDMRRNKQQALDQNNVEAIDGSRVHTEDYLEALAKYGRLTVIDEDDLVDATASSVSSTISAWIDSVQSAEPEAKMLVLVDYWQRTNPDEDQLREHRSRQLELAAKQLKTIVRKKPCALVLAAQANDDHTGENSEPERNDMRDSKGGNNEAANLWLMHRWSNAQASRLRDLLAPPEVAERLPCTTIFSDKARSAEAGWRAVLRFRGNYYRFTDAIVPAGQKYPTNWLADYTTLDLARPDKRAKTANNGPLGEGLSLAPPGDKGPLG